MLEIGEGVDIIIADETVLVLGAVAEENGKGGDGFNLVTGW